MSSNKKGIQIPVYVLWLKWEELRKKNFEKSLMEEGIQW